MGASSCGVFNGGDCVHGRGLALSGLTVLRLIGSLGENRRRGNVSIDLCFARFAIALFGDRYSLSI